MEFLKKIWGNRALSVVLLSGISIAIVAVFIFLALPQSAEASEGSRTTEIISSGDPATFSKLVLNTQGLSCSSCVEDITGALADVNGVGDVNVNLQTNEVTVFYDPGVVKDVNVIPSTVTNIGYTSRIINNLDKEDIAEQQREKQTQSRFYVAAVGSYKIPRSDFSHELKALQFQYKKQYGDDVFTTPQGEQLLQNLKLQALNGLVDDAVLMGAVEKAEFTVSDDILAAGFQEMITANNLSSEAELKERVEGAGYDYEYFRKKAGKSVLIKEFIKGTVFKPENTDYQNDQEFYNWYQNVKTLSPVTYYDEEIEDIINSQNAAGGGGCCG